MTEIGRWCKIFVLQMFFVPNVSSLLKSVLVHYVETVSIHKRSHKSEVYRIKALNDLMGQLTLGEITPMHVVAFRDRRLATPHPRDAGRMLAPSTVKHELMLLSHLFSTAIAEWGMDNLINPVLKVRKPRAPPGRIRRLTPHEEKSYCEPLCGITILSFTLLSYWRWKRLCGREKYCPCYGKT